MTAQECENCSYSHVYSRGEHFLECKISLPPWINHRQGPKLVSPWQSCDLGKWEENADS